MTDNALLSSDDLAWLRRFRETTEDDQSYDVPKERMQRLAQIGVVRRTHGSHYTMTDFGVHALRAPRPAVHPIIDARAVVNAASDVLDAYRSRFEVVGRGLVGPIDTEIDALRKTLVVAIQESEHG